MDAQWIRNYRPHPSHLDELPALLHLVTLAADPVTLEAVITAALVKRGNVVTQKTMRREDGAERLRYVRARAREAQAAEARA